MDKSQPIQIWNYLTEDFHSKHRLTLFPLTRSQVQFHFMMYQMMTVSICDVSNAEGFHHLISSQLLFYHWTLSDYWVWLSVFPVVIIEILQCYQLFAVLIILQSLNVLYLRQFSKMIVCIVTCQKQSFPLMIISSTLSRPSYYTSFHHPVVFFLFFSKSTSYTDCEIQICWLYCLLFVCLFRSFFCSFKNILCFNMFCQPLFPWEQIKNVQFQIWKRNNQQIFARTWKNNYQGLLFFQ